MKTLKFTFAATLAIVSAMTLSSTAEARRPKPYSVSTPPPPPPCMYGSDASGNCNAAPVGSAPGCHITIRTINYDRSYDYMTGLDEQSCNTLKTSAGTGVVTGNPGDPINAVDGRVTAQVLSQLTTPIDYGTQTLYYFSGGAAGYYAGTSNEIALKALDVINAFAYSEAEGASSRYSNLLVKGTWVSGAYDPSLNIAATSTPPSTISEPTMSEPVVSEPIYTFDWSSFGFFW